MLAGEQGDHFGVGKEIIRAVAGELAECQIVSDAAGVTE